MFKTAQKNLFVVDFIFLKMHKKSLFELMKVKTKIFKKESKHYPISVTDTETHWLSSGLLLIFRQNCNSRTNKHSYKDYSPFLKGVFNFY